MFRYEWKYLKTRKEVKEWFRRRAITYIWDKYCKECSVLLIKNQQ